MKKKKEKEKEEEKKKRETAGRKRDPKLQGKGVVCIRDVTLGQPTRA